MILLRKPISSTKSPEYSRVGVGMGYRILDHTADIGFEVHGATLADLFSQAAFALVDLLTDRAALTGETERIIRIEGADLEDLWINYLREILYQFNGESFLLKDIPEIKFSELSLEASLRGAPYNPCRHTIKTEIKAVTYHRAEVKQTPDGWQGVFIVDV